jgi:hypothetical protein
MRRCYLNRYLILQSRKFADFAHFADRLDRGIHHLIRKAALPLVNRSADCFRIDFRLQTKADRTIRVEINRVEADHRPSCISGCSDPIRHHEPKPAKGAICLSLASRSTGASQLETYRSAGREKELVSAESQR